MNAPSWRKSSIANTSMRQPRTYIAASEIVRYAALVSTAESARIGRYDLLPPDARRVEARFTRKNEDGGEADFRVANRRLQPLGHLTAGAKCT